LSADPIRFASPQRPREDLLRPGEHGEFVWDDGSKVGT
jgi:hypothetical protein